MIDFRVMKTIMPCVEGDRLDCQFLTTTTDFDFGQQSLPRVNNLIYDPQHRA